MAPIQRILVASDFSEAAARALDMAIDIASRFGASITVVHAYELGLPMLPFGVDRIPELDDRIERECRAALDAIVAQTITGGFAAIRGVLRQGVAWQEIDSLAEGMRADLIVMGTHGRRGLAHALLGSVTEKVVRTAPCPVLAVRAPVHGAPLA